MPSASLSSQAPAGGEQPAEARAARGRGAAGARHDRPPAEHVSAAPAVLPAPSPFHRVPAHCRGSPLPEAAAAARTCTPCWEGPWGQQLRGGEEGDGLSEGPGARSFEGAGREGRPMQWALHPLCRRSGSESSRTGTRWLSASEQPCILRCPGRPPLHRHPAPLVALPLSPGNVVTTAFLPFQFYLSPGPRWCLLGS